MPCITLNHVWEWGEESSITDANIYIGKYPILVDAFSQFCDKYIYISLSKAGLLHREPASARTSCDSCHVLGHPIYTGIITQLFIITELFDNNHRVWREGRLGHFSGSSKKGRWLDTGLLKDAVLSTLQHNNHIELWLSDPSFYWNYFHQMRRITKCQSNILSATCQVKKD